MRPTTVVVGCMGMCEYVLSVYLWMWSGRYMVVYILPLCLYTKMTHTLIYAGRVASTREVNNMKQNRTKMASAMLAQLKANQKRIIAQMGGA